ncbi:MAG: TetR/AcrR family transcriptional regulator [Ramlibacter sp.]|nr:TetR/AcrR family transcriptional regulator [Ramlibacter sp.]
MARPSRNIEQALLQSGRQLYAERGAARLSVRALTEHAGVNLGMFHYHFKTKDAFLTRLLDGWYEEMFARLSSSAQQNGPPLERLRAALFFLASFVRDHADVLSRVISDAAAGEPVAVQFMRTNAPRHLRVLLDLMAQAQKEGTLARVPPLQRFIFVMSAVAMPLLVAPGIRSLGVAPGVLGDSLHVQVMSDKAIRQRIELALKALAAGGNKK